ncbi:DEKNAAC102361 [Brettanomyces naardenensis]|uniref:Rhomboid-type serine protease 2 n=1 Tax=Brettanomyces naardenensis TaxID=13370 RepID=A0A448YK67_BRENA|nr:DEKNAAC102361 [Brettanomyces naardenensis]
MASVQDNPNIRKYIDLANGYLRPASGVPALTFVVTLFLVGVFIVSIFDDTLVDNWCLFPEALFDFELTRFTTYPLVHTGFLHLFFNLVSLWAPMAQFEKMNGTVHTALVFNILSVIVAVPYCILGYFFYSDTTVVGASGLVFSFVAYFSYVNSLRHKTVKLFGRYEVPTISVPFVLLGIVFLLVPNSSLIGHFLGIIAGFILAQGWLAPLTVPPIGLIEKIEAFLHRLIDLIPRQISYIKEIDVKDGRYQEDNTSLPLYNTDNAGAPPIVAPRPVATVDAFQGPGHVLGTGA